MSKIILAIESSCDDTGAAIIKDGVVLSNEVANQLVHERYGGVVPELASRAHQANIIPVVQAALDTAGVGVNELDAIAFTRGPGLMGALIVGVSFAKGLALSLKKPMIEVNHLKAHVLAHFAEDPKPEFPFLCLTVSGGHTQIVVVKDYNDMEVIGTTLDDAAGEAFDKTGKLLGLPYPAGPVIDKYAAKGEPVFAFTEPNIEGLNFSFSGLKTSILYFLKNNLKENDKFIQENVYDICASVQSRIVSILINKLRKAIEQYDIRHIAIAGGVSANSALRSAFQSLGEEKGLSTYIPAFQYCTDNAAMIGIAGYYEYLAGNFVGQDISPKARYAI